MTAIENVVDMKCTEDVSPALKQSVKVCQSSLNTVSYLEGASGRLPEFILTKLWNDFFASLIDDNPLSSNCGATAS